MFIEIYIKINGQLQSGFLLRIHLDQVLENISYEDTNDLFGKIRGQFKAFSLKNVKTICKIVLIELKYSTGLFYVEFHRGSTKIKISSDLPFF